MASKSPDPWHISGMVDIKEMQVKVGDIFYRAYSESSRIWGRSFFVPAIPHIDRYQILNYWTADLLERELSAAFWGNDYRYLLTIKANNVIPHLRYNIGSVAQGRFNGVENGRPFSQIDFITPSGVFKEVQFIASGNDDIKQYFNIVEEAGVIKAGRYVRTEGSKE